MRRLFGLAAAWPLALLFATGAHAAAQPKLFRPNPALSAVQVDYVNPIVTAAGAPVMLHPLSRRVIAQAVADQTYLAYQRVGDLGGFLSAPVGQAALSSGGHAVVGAATGTAQIPNYAQAAGGQIRSFGAVGVGTFKPPTTTPENGTQPVPGLGTPATTPPPTNTNTVPPANQGFGGSPGGAQPTTTTTPGHTTPTPTTTARGTTTSPATTTPATTTAPSTTTRPTTTTTPHPTTTTTPTITTAPTTTTTLPPATTTAPPPPNEAPSGASCGTTGLEITSDHSTCQISAVNMGPGGAVSEVLTVTNTTDAPYSLTLRAAGTQTRFWNDLELGVWQAGTAAPDPLPPLVWWAAQDNPLATLQPGDSIRYEVELYLPTSAGNEDQDQTAVVDLVWHAQA